MIGKFRLALGFLVSVAVVVTATVISASIVGAVPPPPATQLAITSVTDETTGLNEPVRGQPFDVVVVSEDQFGNVTPVKGKTTVALSVGSGTGTLSGTLKVTIAAGTSQATIAGARYSVAENGVVLVVSGTKGDSLLPGHVNVDVQVLAAEFTGNGKTSFTLSSSQCTSPSPQIPTCATTTFQHGANGKTFLSEGVCQGKAAACLANAGETSLLMNVTADISGLGYTRTDPAVSIIACDKSLCGGGNINQIPLFVDFNNTGTYVQVPACPSKGTIAPAPAPPYCVDYVSSHRDNAGDTLLVFDFADDYIIHF